MLAFRCGLPRCRNCERERSGMFSSGGSPRLSLSRDLFAFLARLREINGKRLFAARHLAPGPGRSSACLSFDGPLRLATPLNAPLEYFLAIGFSYADGEQ